MGECACLHACLPACVSVCLFVSICVRLSIIACDPNYYYVSGYINGYDSIHSSVTSTQACATLCAADGCMAYEYNFVSQQCQLSSTMTTQSSSDGDYSTCRQRMTVPKGAFAVIVPH